MPVTYLWNSLKDNWNWKRNWQNKSGTYARYSYLKKAHLPTMCQSLPIMEFHYVSYIKKVIRWFKYIYEFLLGTLSRSDLIQDCWYYAFNRQDNFVMQYTYLIQLKLRVFHISIMQAINTKTQNKKNEKRNKRIYIVPVVYKPYKICVTLLRVKWKVEQSGARRSNRTS